MYSRPPRFPVTRQGMIRFSSFIMPHTQVRHSSTFNCRLPLASSLPPAQIQPKWLPVCPESSFLSRVQSSMVSTSFSTSLCQLFSTFFPPFQFTNAKWAGNLCENTCNSERPFSESLNLFSSRALWKASFFFMFAKKKNYMKVVFLVSFPGVPRKTFLTLSCPFPVLSLSLPPFDRHIQEFDFQEVSTVTTCGSCLLEMLTVARL